MCICLFIDMQSYMKNREYENDVNNHVIILVRNVLDTGINIIFVCILKDILQTINKHRSEVALSIWI